MNRLADESSPYLRQHADNPVDWWPWGPDALAEAARRQVPLLISVGYSSCHWCHVMAHESFEDDDTASVMNEGFVNVKVDREERPDVDAVYMEAVQALTGRGGWPMTVFATPDGRPFFGGTYWPKTSDGRHAAFVDVLAAVREAWTNRREELFGQADELTAALGQASRLAGAAEVPGPDVVAAAVAGLRDAHDDAWGGFGRAPKFPTPQNLDLVLRGLATGRSMDPERDLAIATTTLDAMASGGMIDHLGGGFARYSTDERWEVPHFEKMLFDQAGLLSLYVHGLLVTGHDRYRTVIEDLVGYVLRDLRLPGGAIASAEDADSVDFDGASVEGAFYTFTPGEVRAALAAAGRADLADEAISFWGLDGPANFEDRWIPVRTAHRGDWARDGRIDLARRILRSARATRPRPGLDDKVLTEWNAHWVRALAEAGFLLDRTDWIDAAAATAEFLLEHLRRADGRWLRTWQTDAGAKHLAFAADHAALVSAFVTLTGATGRRRWLDEALDAAGVLVDRYLDAANGGFHTTADDGEPLITRDKDLQDGALPSANSTAALAFLELSALTGDASWAERSREVLRIVAPLLRQAPAAFGTSLAALDRLHAPSIEIVVTGDRPDLVNALRGRWLPDAVVSWGEALDGPLWSGRDAGLAYVCRDFTCGLPASTPNELVDRLADSH